MNGTMHCLPMKLRSKVIINTDKGCGCERFRPHMIQEHVNLVWRGVCYGMGWGLEGTENAISHRIKGRMTNVHTTNHVVPFVTEHPVIILIHEYAHDIVLF